MDCKNSLALTSTFGDFDNYKIVYLMNFGNFTKENLSSIRSIIKFCNFDWIPFEIPKNTLEKHALILSLDAVVYEYNKTFEITYKFDKKDIRKAKKMKFPPQLSCNSALWKYMVTPNRENLVNFYTALDNGMNVFDKIDKVEIEEYIIWDFCVALIQIIYGIDKNEIKDLFFNFTLVRYNKLLQCIFVIANCLKRKRPCRINNMNYHTMYLGILASFGIRQIEGRDCKIGYGNLFSVCRNSIYFQKLASCKVNELKEEAKATEVCKLYNYNCTFKPIAKKINYESTYSILFQ